MNKKVTKIIGVIPARYASTRFPGKPLADICGKPMIWWVYQQAKKVKELTEVYVATEDQRIIDIVEGFGGKAILTSKKCLTGTDRVAEVSEKIEANLYVVMQGDEPLMESENITIAINAMLNQPEVSCVTLKSAFVNPVDVVNTSTPKIVCDTNGFALLISRSPIPYPHLSINFEYYKPLGIYVFERKTLQKFKSLSKGFLESTEESELLRLIERGEKIFVEQVVSNSIAVDTEKDLERVREHINNTFTNGGGTPLVYNSNRAVA